jgi:hypothetical protein
MAEKQAWQSANMKKAGAATPPNSMNSKITARSFHCSNGKVGKPSVPHYADGGAVEADDKAAGLAASSGEKLGLFERLRMGNIDDPNSEAYKRLGAGRGEQERKNREMDALIDSIKDKPMADEAPKTVAPASDMVAEKEPGWDTPAAAPARPAAKKAPARNAVRRSASAAPKAAPPMKSVMTDNSVRDAEMARLRRGGPKPVPRSVVFK